MEERNRGRRLCDQNARDSSGFLNRISFQVEGELWGT